MPRLLTIAVAVNKDFNCQKCGRAHARAYIVRDDNGTEWWVGSTCCRKMFGWEPSKQEVQAATETAIWWRLESLLWNGKEYNASNNRPAYETVAAEYNVSVSRLTPIWLRHFPTLMREAMERRHAAH